MEEWPVPGTSWKLSGHSRALERTGFFLDPLNVVLDAGVDLPLNSGKIPAAIFVTHGHIDHIGSLPMLLRHSNGDPEFPLAVFAPAEIMHRLRSFCQLSWSVKVDIEAELPVDYSPPPEEERMPARDGHELRSVGRAVWRPVGPGLSIDVMVGKPWKKKGTNIKVYTLSLFHGLCTAVGFLFAEVEHEKKVLRPDLVGSTKKETGQNVRNAKGRGEEINVIIKIPEKPRLAFVCDTTTKALHHSTETSRAILSCPTIMIECTYLEFCKAKEAEVRGHSHWFGIQPYIIRNFEDPDKSTCWILIHFSLRYTDSEILNFFESKDKCGIRFCRKRSQQETRNTANNQSSSDAAQPSVRPPQPPTPQRQLAKAPDLVLWLDSGIVELWIEEVVFTMQDEECCKKCGPSIS